MHVCWHRNLSVSLNDHRQAIKNQLSGYLLRKFKNSNGWQKLWVIFTNFCLFFYKTYQVNQLEFVEKMLVFRFEGRISVSIIAVTWLSKFVANGKRWCE